MQDALYERRCTLTELSVELEINNGYLSSLIWGTQRNYSQESRIAEALGRSWSELFAPEAQGRAA